MKGVRKVLILRGLQGSGKSTFAKQWVNEDPEHRVRFNRDDIRNMLGKYWVPSRESLINTIQNDFLSSALYQGYDIVIDNMNLNEKCIKEIKTFVQGWNNVSDSHVYDIEIKDFFDVPLEVCIERDSKRENPIGERVIRSTYNKYRDNIAQWKPSN